LPSLRGCEVISRPQGLGYGDYVALSCDQLAQEALHLMQDASDRSQHLLTDDRARRDAALARLRSVREASAAKQC
jgi:hypothetical protein